MVTISVPNEIMPVGLSLLSQPNSNMSNEEFYTFCQSNPNLRIERNVNGEVLIMSPTFSDTGNRNNRIAYQLTDWSDRQGIGEVFDSSTGFTLPNGAIRSPDVAWIRNDRWNALTDSQKSSFAPICPDFVVELRSGSDNLKSLQEKMQEYIENGTILGLLIDRQTRTVYCYRANGSVTVLDKPETVNCDPELPNFNLAMAKIW